MWGFNTPTSTLTTVASRRFILKTCNNNTKKTENPRNQMTPFVALNFYFKVKVVKCTFTLKVGVLHFQFVLYFSI